jgi:hypothetical protein
MRGVPAWRSLTQIGDTIATFHFLRHPSSVSALRADPPSPTRGEGQKKEHHMTGLADAGSVAARAQPAGNPAQSPAGADNGSAAPGAKSWFDSLSEGNRKLAETKGWTKPESLDRVFTSYAELERQQGESLRVPAPDASREDWDRFHARLPEAMRPVTSSEKVEYRRPEGLPENFAYSDELANASKAWAVEAGASPRTAQAYHDRFVGYMAEQAARQEIARPLGGSHPRRPCQGLGTDRQRRLSPEAGGRQPGDEEARPGRRLQGEGHPSA